MREHSKVTELAELAHFEITSCNPACDLEDKNRFRKLEMTSGQRMQLSGLAQQLPSVAAGGLLSNAYTVRFPEGLPHTLTALKQGGFGSMIRGENGQFAGSASLFELSTQAALLNVFTVMSTVTGQYFLAEINSRMDKMNQKIDKILEFLYTEKKAELIAELNFVRYAHKNFTSIMEHEQQRLATIIGLQNAQRIALKDIEFYLNDLDSTVSAKAKNFEELVEASASANRIYNSLELAMQLYVTGSLLEVYYAENFDQSYLMNVEEMNRIYIVRYERQVLSSYSKLNAKLEDIKLNARRVEEKTALQADIQAVIDHLNRYEESSLRKTLNSVLYAANKGMEYYLTTAGDVYCSAN